MGQSVSILRIVWYYLFIFIQILIDYSVNSEDTGSALFVFVPKNDRLIWVNDFVSSKSKRYIISLFRS